MHTQETRIYFTLLAATTVLVFLMVFFIITIILYQRKKAAIHEGSIKQQIKYIENEKGRIAVELHDDIGASLSAIKLRLQCLELDDNSQQVNINFAENQIDIIMQKLRGISQHMMPEKLKRKGLKMALIELVDYMLEGSKIRAHFSATEINIENDAAIQLYRIVQEILNNLLKHSQASNVDISIEQDYQMFTLKITDNGKGFSKHDVIKNSEGIGLRNIMARIDILNAKLYLTTLPGKGVDYQIEIKTYGFRKNKSHYS
ncbi:MAG: ATP-binding protein [Ginsengibacter sp.]